MGISTFYSYPDDTMAINTRHCKPENDHVENVEVTLAGEKRKDRIHTKADMKNLEQIRNPINEDEQTSRILKYLESLHSKGIDQYSLAHDIKEMSLTEKCDDTHFSMKEFDVFLKEECGVATLSSSGKHSSDIDSDANMTYVSKTNNSLTPTSSPEVKNNVMDLSKEGPRRKVTFHTDVVTRVDFFKPLSMEEKKNCFYTSNEMQQFRMEYLWELHRMDEYDHLDAKGLEVWDSIQYCGETVLRFLFPLHI